MFIRSILSLLLLASFAISTMAQPPVKREKLADQENADELTSEEERGARDLMEKFIERLEKSEDIAPLVKEFFVEDFTERMRENMGDNFPLATTPEVAAQLSSDEILRAYTASINCVFIGSAHYLKILDRHANERKMRGEPKDDGADQKVTIQELYPPKLIELMESDPALAAMFEKEKREETEETPSPNEIALIEAPSVPDSAGRNDSQESQSLEDLIPFKSREQMLHYTSLAEQTVVLLREQIHSSTNQPGSSMRETWHKLRGDSTDEEDAKEDTITPRLDILNYEFMGYSPGTRLISATIMMFHLDMVRTPDGRLKVLNFRMLMD